MEHNSYPGETGTVSLHGLVRVLIDGLNGEMPLLALHIDSPRCDSPKEKPIVEGGESSRGVCTLTSEDFRYQASILRTIILGTIR